MTTTTYTAPLSNADNATMRSWVGPLVTALQAVCTQTADTGQIDPTTITVPGAINTPVGYIILTLAHATNPLYVKVEFGTGGGGSAVLSTPQIWLTIGKGTNGAGTLSGVLYARVALGASGTSNQSSASALSGVASGGTDWVSLVPWLSATASGLPWFHIERTTDGTSVVVSHMSTGVTTPGNFTLTSTSALGLPFFSAISYTTGALNMGIVPVLVPYNVNGTILAGSTSLAAGSIGPAYPWLAIAPALAPWQCVSALSYPGGDAPGAAFQVVLGGVTRTYFPVPLSNNHHGMGIALLPGSGSTSTFSSRYVGLAIRWE